MIEIQQNRDIDSALQKVCEQFFDKIYSQRGYCFERVYDVKRQIQGYDVILEKDGRKVVVDEKCATKYFHRLLNTFQFELSFELCDKYTRTSTGKRIDGWLINPKNKTEYYSLGYVLSDQLEQFSSGNINYFECIFVQKQNIMDFINKYVQDIKMEHDIFIHSIESNKIPLIRNKYSVWIHPKIKMVCQNSLAERPVSIIINKSDLISISDFHEIMRFDKNEAKT